MDNGGITLVEGDVLISDNQEVAETLKLSFDGDVVSFNVYIPIDVITDTTGVADPIEAMIFRYSDHRGIRRCAV